MTERSFRLILGASLLLMLYLDFELGIYIYIGILCFEGLTNWRIPVLVSRARFGDNYKSNDILSPDCSKISFDAERALRLIAAGFLVITFVIFKTEAWFFPWFIGSMLLLAGITNICPMVMGLRWAGFR